METNTIQKLQMYISAELSDSALYSELAKIAPDEDSKKYLLEFSRDEQKHADEFNRIYRQLTGRYYNPEVLKPNVSGDYRDILRDRIIDESGDFRKYGEQYIQTFRNMDLKEAYYRARTDENVHALRLLYLLNK